MSETIIIVSGLPRSGTSMMMKMLEAGGLDTVVDNIREADEDNPKGYYEFERVKKIKEDDSWLNNVKGKAVKMVSMLLYDLPSEIKYKIIFMKRNIEEILASQQAMLERRGEKQAVGDEEMGELFSRHLKEIEKWLGEQKNIEVLYLNYRDVIEKSHESADSINKFMGNTLDVEKMAKTVDKSLYRKRSNNKNPEASVSEQNMNDQQEKEKIEAQLRALGYL